MMESTDGGACIVFRARMSAYLDGELISAENFEFEQHIEKCAACDAALAGLRSASRWLRRHGRRVTSPPAWEAIADRLSEGTAASGARRWWWMGRPLYLAAAIAASFGLGLMVATMVRSPSAPSAPGPDETASITAPHTAGIPSLDAYLAVHRVREVPMRELADYVAFAPMAPQELPGGFRAERSFVVFESGSTNTCVIYRRGEETVGLLQQEPRRRSEFVAGGFEERRLGGFACRVVRRRDCQVFQIDPDGVNLTVVSGVPTLDLERLIRHLKRSGR